LRCFTRKNASARRLRRGLVRSCNPLAGIEVFHTKTPKTGGCRERDRRVVIPWRGLRCFTRVRGRRDCHPWARSGSGCNPLAGIEVFHTKRRTRRSSGTVPRDVVIPWRGFRCFTPRVIRRLRRSTTSS